MDRIELTPTALSRMRFYVSPLGMLSALLRHVASRQRHPTLGRIAPHLAPALRSVSAPLIRELVPDRGEGVMPLLVPAPVPGLRGVRDELALLAARTDEDCRDELALGGRPLPLAERLLDRGRLTTQLIGELRTVWEVALAPTWATIERNLREDTRARGDQMATNGLADVLSSLHGRIHWAGSSLLVDRGREKETRVDESGLVLVPSAFDLIPRLNVEAAVPCVSYPVAIEPATADRYDAARLLGRTRARVLGQADRARTTSEIADRLGLPTSTVSDHLQVLYRAGLVARERDGRVVRYERIPGRLS